jgi:hypothetical protein
LAAKKFAKIYPIKIMAELSHNTTIGGFRVLYEGMENPILLNTLTINADLVVSGSILGNA